MSHVSSSPSLSHAGRDETQASTPTNCACRDPDRRLRCLRSLPPPCSTTSGRPACRCSPPSLRPWMPVKHHSLATPRLAGQPPPSPKLLRKSPAYPVGFTCTACCRPDGLLAETSILSLGRTVRAIWLVRATGCRRCLGSLRRRHSPPFNAPNPMTYPSANG